MCTSDSRIFTYFPKGLTHDFGQKWHFLHFLFLGKIHLEQMFGDLFDRKESFIA